ncbi:MAG: hypothetical protein OEU54_07120 [Gemmatimonadota bacterium]|nr:hypothetical protein [Gemmatimonadota bacterium]
MAAENDHDTHDIEDVEPIDLSGLDPTADRARFDLAVARVVEAARFELAKRGRRRQGFSAIPKLWGRVAWPAAAAVALTSVAVLRANAPAIGATIDPISVEEEMALAVGVPEALAGWVEATESPVLGEILVGWEEER